MLVHKNIHKILVNGRGGKFWFQLKPKLNEFTINGSLFIQTHVLVQYTSLSALNNLVLHNFIVTFQNSSQPNGRTEFSLAMSWKFRDKKSKDPVKNWIFMSKESEIPVIKLIFRNREYENSHLASKVNLMSNMSRVFQFQGKQRKKNIIYDKI